MQWVLYMNDVRFWSEKVLDGTRLESNHPFLVLKGANEKSFVVFQRANGNYKKD
jgi:hypothetical protein